MTIQQKAEDVKEFYTHKDIAKFTGRSIQGVIQSCRRGTIPAKKLGRVWLVHKSHLPAPRPSKPATNQGGK